MTLGQEQIEGIQQAVEAGLLDASHVQGRNVVCTGRMSYSREEMHQLIAALGGWAQDSVSWTTSLIIVGDTGRHGVTAKIRTARERGVRIMSEKEFVASINARTAS